VLVLGANLAIDRTLRMEQLRPGHVQRPRSADLTAGGKSVNVCRAAAAHRVRPRLVANLPGVLGAYVGDLLAAEGLDVVRVATAGEIRSATIILEEDGRTTVLNEPGPDLSEPDRAALLAAVRACLGGTDVVVLSGSLPPGTASDLYADVVAMARRRGQQTVVDAARQALAAVLAAGPDVVTPNLGEAIEALALVNGGPTPLGESVEPDSDDVPRDATAAALALVAAGARAALVTAGRHGVAGADAQGTFWVQAPVVAEVNPIGAGDSFVAGLAAALEAGAGLREATLVAVATGSASVATPLAGRVDEATMQALLATLAPAEQVPR
jgi:1-phosphofructokinase family hexose kinase